MPKQRKRSAITVVLIRPRYWHIHGSTAEWLGELRDFLLEHRDVDVPIDEQLCPALHELERESRTWLYNMQWLLDFRLWDLPRLTTRDPAIAKPRIDFLFEVTGKDNLSVRWTPTQHPSFAPLDQQDFAEWKRHPFLNDSAIPPSRPNNEIAFVRGIGRLRLHGNGEYPSPRATYLDMRNRLLVYATRAFVNEIEEFPGSSSRSVSDGVRLRAGRQWTTRRLIPWFLTPTSFGCGTSEEHSGCPNRTILPVVP